MLLLLLRTTILSPRCRSLDSNDGRNMRLYGLTTQLAGGGSTRGRRVVVCMVDTRPLVQQQRETNEHIGVVTWLPRILPLITGPLCPPSPVPLTTCNHKVPVTSSDKNFRLRLEPKIGSYVLSQNFWVTAWAKIFQLRLVPKIFSYVLGQKFLVTF